MSEYQAISAASESIRMLLWPAIDNDNDTKAIIGTEQQISTEPPFKLVKDTDADKNYLSLYLYRVAENAEMKNRALIPQSANQLQYPPLALNLSYLVTPLTNSADNDQRLLGKVMQILHDNTTLAGAALRGVLQGTDAELRIVLGAVSIEDMTKLWSATLRPYRLSVAYDVRVLYIDSARRQVVEPVRRKTIAYGPRDAA